MKFPPDTRHQMIDHAKRFLALEDAFIDCDDLLCQDCPFYHPAKNLQIVDDVRITHCGYVFINRAIRAVLDRAPEGV